MRKSPAKATKVNSLSLARASAQLYTKIEFDLQPILQDKALNDALEKIGTALSKFEGIIQTPEKSSASEVSSDFLKTDKALEKIKDRVNDLQEFLEKTDKVVHDKLITKLAVLNKTDSKDATDTANRAKVETDMKLIKNLIESGKKKLKELQEPTEITLKRMHAIKPKLYALGLPENFDRCYKRAEKLNEEIGFLCSATAEIVASDALAIAATLLKDNGPAKLFLPKLSTEIAKSGTLLQQVSAHLARVFPEQATSASAFAAETASGAAASVVTAASPARTATQQVHSVALEGKEESKSNRLAS